MLNVAVLEPAGTETVAGTPRTGLSLESDITAFTAPAALDRVRMQMVDVPDVIVLALQDREPSPDTPNTRDSGAVCVLPFSVALIETL
jgi:hypothetical protein